MSSRPSYVWTLRQPPEYGHRHYAVSVNGAKPVWNGAGKRRIVSVTKVLDGDAGSLLGWATSHAVYAAEQTMQTWFGVSAAYEASSVLSFGELCKLSGLMPDDIRDAKGATGTALHEYAAAWLKGEDCTVEQLAALPYGLRCAVDAFHGDHDPRPLYDVHGPRVERAVGDYRRAVAGTYDAQVRLWTGQGAAEHLIGQRPIHRIDYKQSNSVRGSMFAQLAAYERMARGCGEQRSHFLTVVHCDDCGNFKLHTIPAAGEPYKLALSVFDAALTLYRGNPQLGKLLSR